MPARRVECGSPLISGCQLGKGLGRCFWTVGLDEIWQCRSTTQSDCYFILGFTRCLVRIVFIFPSPGNDGHSWRHRYFNITSADCLCCLCFSISGVTGSSEAIYNLRYFFLGQYFLDINGECLRSMANFVNYAVVLNIKIVVLFNRGIRRNYRLDQVHHIH